MRNLIELIRGIVTIFFEVIAMGAIWEGIIAGAVRIGFKIDEVYALLFIGLPCFICVTIFYCWKLWPTQRPKFTE